MTHSRREFLRGTGAVALLGATGGWGSPARAEDPEAITLHARPGTVHLPPPGYPETPIWGYDGSVPGPTIRVPHGQRVTRRFVNGLPQPSTVHWHGIRIENSMDGASELTQPPVQPGAEFLYDFEPPDAGTWWYHSHHRAWEQMARGLYGALVVEERIAPEVDWDEVLLLDDWRLTNEATHPGELRRPARLGPRGPHGQLDHGQRRRRVAPGVVAVRAAAASPRQRGERADLRRWSCSRWKAGWWRWMANRSRRRRRPDRWCSHRASEPT